MTALFERAIDAHQDPLDLRALPASIGVTVFANDHRRPDGPLGEIVVKGDARLVEEREQVVSNSRRKAGFGLWPASREQLGRRHGGLAGKNVRVGKVASLQIEASGQARASCWQRTTAARRKSARSSL